MPVTTAEPSTLLNQVIAVRASVKNDTEQALTKHYHLLQRSALLDGLSRTYTPRDDDGFVYPGESNMVQVKAEQVLAAVANDMTRLFDVTAALDWTNQRARGDIVLLGGEQPVTLLADVPVTYLMFLEKKLTDLETVVRKLPVLDPGQQWELDPNTDTYRSQPVVTVKTKKIPRNHVLAPATDKHPAQVQVYQEDIPEGTWTTVKFSGALPASKINEILNRIKTLLAAVKFAREQANLQTVTNVHPGKQIFAYLFGL